MFLSKIWHVPKKLQVSTNTKIAPHAFNEYEFFSPIANQQ